MQTKILCVLDGFGLLPSSHNNAVALAHTPTLNRLFATKPWTTLDADGESVGQEHGLVGNSEVGHMNIGGLQLVKQLSYQITKASEQSFDLTREANEQLFEPQKLLHKHTSHVPNNLQKAFGKIVGYHSQYEYSDTIHLIGLFSTGTIHSDLRHWVGAIEAAGKSGCKVIVLHLISDGRDSDRTSFVKTWKNWVETYQKRLAPYHSKIQLGSVIGRFYAMDRDNNMDRTKHAVDAMFNGQTTIHFEEIEEKLTEITKNSYDQKIFDENIAPSSPGRGIQNGDMVWLINFRSDRMKQLARELVEKNHHEDRELFILANNNYGIGYEYIESDSVQKLDHIRNHKKYVPLFMRKELENTLADFIVEEDKTQLHIAETEKYAHVTYFMNGGKNEKHENEEWILIDSNKVESHAQKPAMKCEEITDYILEHGIGKFDYIIVNYANPDMIGHTGELRAAIESMEILDAQLTRLVDAVESQKHTMIITADHGNIEVVGEYEQNEDEYLDTEHNPNPVPLLVISPEFSLDQMNKQLNDLKFEMDIPKHLMVEHFNNLENKNTAFDDKNNWIIADSIPAPQYPLWYAGLVLICL
jgi:2,3-bisphosphoglycerate-independent phosphoglycerate mutase